MTKKVVLASTLTIFTFLSFTACQAYKEKPVAKRVTIRVMRQDITPMTSTVLRLESEKYGAIWAIQAMTNSRGIVFFKQLTPDTYKISINVKLCDNQRVQTVEIKGFDVYIDYYPCG